MLGDPFTYMVQPVGWLFEMVNWHPFQVRVQILLRNEMIAASARPPHGRLDTEWKATNQITETAQILPRAHLDHDKD